MLFMDIHIKSDEPENFPGEQNFNTLMRILKK